MLWQRFTEASPSRLRGLLCWVPGLLKCFFKTMMQYRNSLHRDILNISLTFIIPEINTLTLTINLFSHYHWWIFFFLKHAISQVSSWGDIITRWWGQESLSTAVTHTLSAMSCFSFLLATWEENVGQLLYVNGEAFASRADKSCAMMDCAER